MKPLILITNDDGVNSRGLRHLAQIASEFGEVVVMAPDHNASGVSTSITCTRPLRAYLVEEAEGITYYACDGTPADCVKMGHEHFCSRPPDLVLSGINYGNNASINVVYSGTMGAVLEACLNGYQSAGFSLLSHSPSASFDGCTAAIRQVIKHLLQHPLPQGTALNVNIPNLPANQLKGLRVCRQAWAGWRDSLEKRTDPVGRPYWWMTGKFVCPEPPEDTDQYLLEQGYVTVVPVTPDFTAHEQIRNLKVLEQ